jgi:hypothetical protein
MKRGLIVGNSHVAMLIKAWNTDRDRFTNISIEFFAQPGDGPKDFDINGTYLRATGQELIRFLETVNLKTKFDLAEFDFIVIVACGMSVYQTLGALRGFQVWGWPFANVKPRSVEIASEKHLISANCFQAALDDIFSNTVGMKLAEDFRHHSALPIVIVPQPLPSELVIQDKRKGAGFKAIEENGQAAQCYQAFLTSIHSVASKIDNINVIEQPKISKTKNLYTRTDFTAGAVRLFDLNKEHPINDTLHANQHFGTLILEEISDLAEVLCDG